jgi:hypothetical protein
LVRRRVEELFKWVQTYLGRAGVRLAAVGVQPAGRATAQRHQHHPQALHRPLGRDIEAGGKGQGGAQEQSLKADSKRNSKRVSNGRGSNYR